MLFLIILYCGIFAAGSKIVLGSDISEWRDLLLGSLVGGFGMMALNMILDASFPGLPVVVNLLIQYAAIFGLIIAAASFFSGFSYRSYGRVAAAAAVIMILLVGIVGSIMYITRI